LADIEKLVVALEARTKAFENALNRANGVANRRAKDIETRFTKMNKAITSRFAMAGGDIAKAFAVIGGAKGFQSLADSATNITNALKVAGLSGDDLTRTYDRLFVSAQKNSAPIESLVQLYSRVSLVQKELGVSSDQLVGLTDNVGKSLRLSGSNAQEASGALMQLAQALGSNKIQAEEWNSLIDGMPGLLQAAAAGIKQAEGSVSKLTQLVKSGRISNKAFFDGIEAGSYVLDEKLAGSTKTIEQRFTDLRNALINATSKFNENSKAAETVGNAIGGIATEIDNVNFDQLITQISAVVTALQEARATSESFLSKLSEISGFDGIGRDIVNMLPGVTEGGTKSYFGGALTITSTAKITDRINEAFETQIQQAGALTSEAIKNSVLGQNGNKKGRIAPLQGPNLPAGYKKPQVDIDNDKYKPLATGGSGKAKRAKLDEYERSVKQITERTAALNAETAAQSSLNPYINDYGFASERAATAQDLLSAAQAAGTAAGKELTDVQQLLSGQFDGLSPKAKAQAEAMLLLANNSAQAVVNSNQLHESQDRLRQSMEEWRDLSKDATKGFIQDLIDGKSAIDALSGALQKLGDKLLDSALDGLFGAGGSNNWFSGLFSGFSGGTVKAASGGHIRGPGTGTSDSIPARLSDGEYVVNAAATRKHRDLLDAINSGRMLSLAKGGPVSSPSPSTAPGGGFSFSFAPVLNAEGADASELAALRKDLARLKAEIPGTVVSAVKNAQLRRML
jgi:tape measure domain-containing protein